MVAPANNTAERSVEISRLINAPRELVWQAMTEPQMPEPMVGPDVTRDPNHPVFKEITPPSRWVFDHGDC